MVPAGYVETEIRVDDTDIPAYTMKSDMDNNYLLLYLQGPGGEKAVYQYDRSEKTLQKYTGDMIERVNKGGEHGYVTEDSSDEGGISRNILLVFIAILIVIILCMFVYILKLVSKNQAIKRKTNYDDLDL
jgi:hypothetical protein